MRGTISFHPIDTGFFEKLIAPLLAGQKVNPEEWVAAGLRLQRAAWCCDRYVRLLEDLLDGIEPPPPPEDGTLWDKIRTRLERFDFRPEAASVIVARKIEPDLHLAGRPFFITEGSADRVSAIVDEYRSTQDMASAESLVLAQLARLDEELERVVNRDRGENPPPDLLLRREMLADLKGLYDLGRAADGGGAWAQPGEKPRPAIEVLCREVPWRSVMLASRSVPYWIAQDVDGIETICRAAGVTLPDFVLPAWRLFSDACDRFPGFGEGLTTELKTERDLGAYVAPEHVGSFLEFLNLEGARIIRIATQAGEGPACTTLLRKIRECARYAEEHEMGYLEASGIPPIVRC